MQEAGLDVVRGLRCAPSKKGLDYRSIRDFYLGIDSQQKYAESMSESELRQWARQAAAIVSETETIREQKEHYQSLAANITRELDEYQHRIPVASVIAELTGMEPRREISKKAPREIVTFCMSNGQKIDVNPETNRFENLTTGIPFPGSNVKWNRGRGALNAVMMITSWTRRQSIQWIFDVYGKCGVRKAVIEMAELESGADADDDARIQRRLHGQNAIRELEVSDESTWPGLFELLTKKLGFHDRLISKLHANGDIGSNQFGNLLFVKKRHDLESVTQTGKIIVDYKEAENPLKETGEHGLWSCIEDGAETAIICSSPLEAIAIKSTPEHLKASIVVISKDPDSFSELAIANILRRHRHAMFAETAAANGNQIKEWFVEKFPGIPTLGMAPGHKNWISFLANSNKFGKSDPSKD